MNNELFVSYSRRDTEFARRLTESFKSKGLNAWVDWQDIPPSVDWMSEIKKGIEEADIFVFLVSPDSVISDICAAELAHGILNGKRIIPVIVREIDMKSAPATITHLNWIFFPRPQDIFEDAFEKLMTAIQTDYDWVQVHRRLQVKALEWERNHVEDSFLLRGKDLEDAEAQVKVNGEKAPFLTDLQKTYVQNSRVAEDKQLEQRRVKEKQLEVEKTVGVRSRRLTYILMAIFTIAFAVLYLWLYHLVTDLSLKSLKDQMIAIVETSSVPIDGDQLQKLIGSYPAGSNDVSRNTYFTSLEELLTRVKHTNTKIDPNMSLYVISKGSQANEVLVIASADREYKFKDPYGSENQSNAQFLGMQSTANDFEINNNEFVGDLISACTPILNNGSEPVGALCTDFHVNIVRETQGTVAKTLGLAFLAIYPAILLAVFFTTRSLSKLSRSVTAS